MLAEMSIPIEAYRLASGAGDSWAWSASRGPAMLAKGADKVATGGSGVMSLGFSADGRYLLGGTARIEVQTGDVLVPVTPKEFGAGLTGKLLPGLARKFELTCAAWAPDADLVVVSIQHRPTRNDGWIPDDMPPMRLLAFDAAGALVAELGEWAHPHVVVGTEWVFATGGLTIDAWKRSDLTKRDQKIPAPPGISALTLSRDQTWLAFASNQSTGEPGSAAGWIGLWNIAGTSKGAEWRADRRVADVAWHPDGTRIATAGEEGAKLWRIEGSSATEIAHGGIAGPATAVAFAPDGAELLVGLGGAKPRVVRLAVEP